MKRATYIALVAVLLSVPAVGVAGGPDALSIAKRALRLAKEPVKVKQLHTNVAWEDGLFRVLCPRGWVAVGVSSASSALGSADATGVNGREGWARVPGAVPGGSSNGPAPAITLTCIKGELVPQAEREPLQVPH